MFPQWLDVRVGGVLQREPNRRGHRGGMPRCTSQVIPMTRDAGPTTVPTAIKQCFMALEPIGNAGTDNAGIAIDMVCDRNDGAIGRKTVTLID